MLGLISLIKYIHSFIHSLTHSLEDKIRYLLTLDNENTSKIVGKYTHLMSQREKRSSNQRVILLFLYEYYRML